MDKVGALYRLSAEDGRLPEFDLAGAASFAMANRWSGPLKFIYSGKYSKPRQTRSDQGYLSTFGGTADGNELIRGQTYFYNPHNGKVYSSLEAYNGKTSSVSKPSKPIEPPKEMRAETVTAEEGINNRIGAIIAQHKEGKISKAELIERLSELRGKIDNANMAQQAAQVPPQAAQVPPQAAQQAAQVPPVAMQAAQPVIAVQPVYVSAMPNAAMPPVMTQMPSSPNAMAAIIRISLAMNDMSDNAVRALAQFGDATEQMAANQILLARSQGIGSPAVSFYPNQSYAAFQAGMPPQAAQMQPNAQAAAGAPNAQAADAAPQFSAVAESTDTGAPQEVVRIAIRHKFDEKKEMRVAYPNQMTKGREAKNWQATVNDLLKTANPGEWEVGTIVMNDDASLRHRDRVKASVATFQPGFDRLKGDPVDAKVKAPAEAKPGEGRVDPLKNEGTVPPSVEKYDFANSKLEVSVNGKKYTVREAVNRILELERSEFPRTKAEFDAFTAELKAL